MRFLLSLFLLLIAIPLRAEVPPLLNEVAKRWADERNHWTFTQQVREYEGKNLVEERLERFDLARGDDRRWELLKINGHAPTREEEAAWSKRKNKPRKKETTKALTDYVDLEQARVLEENARTVTYELPMRKMADWIFPGDKVDLSVTINKKSRMIERGRIEVDGPFKVALGLAKVVDLDFDLELPPDPKTKRAGQEPAQAQGSGYAVVNKLGRRVEYTWSDFSRHAELPGARRS